MKSNVYSINDYNVFEQSFKNRQDFISYLKTSKTSLAFAGKKLSSALNDHYGIEWTKTKNFEEALELFEYGWYENFDKFLVQKREIDKYFPYISKKKTYHNYLCGSVPNVVNAINNLPLSMRKTYENNNKQNNIIIYYNCCYSYKTTQNQIFNNGLLTLSLIDFFESLGYRIDLRFYNISKYGNQILYVDIVLKESGDNTNLQKFYFAFCNPSFLRRLLFRVTETTQGLDKSWAWCYGNTMSTKEIKTILNIDDNAIFINSPYQMGVNGENIKEDTKIFLDKINLSDYITIDEDKFNICDDKHVLKKKR